MLIIRLFAGITPDVTMHGTLPYEPLDRLDAGLHLLYGRRVCKVNLDY